MKTAKNLALLSMIFVTAFATTQVNAFGIVESALNTAGNLAEDATLGAADITSAAVGGPYYGRPVTVVRPVVYGGEQYGTQVEEPMAVEEQTYTTQPVGTQEEIEAGVTEDYPMGY